MQVRRLKDADWPEVMRLQAQAYYDISPEPEAVMRSKALASAATCLVCVDEDETLIGYCLSHPWPVLSSPPLDQISALCHETHNLFIHDLAVAPQAIGKGVAACLVAAIFESGRRKGLLSGSLVAIQNSPKFWEKFGFLACAEISVSASYGDGAVFMEKAIL